MEQSILDYAENNFLGNISNPTLITLLCIKGGVTFNETEEKCPKVSHLTLTRALKTLAESEEVGRIRKRKRVETKQQRETTLVVEVEDELGHEERGGGGWGLEDYIEQLVLFPTTEEEIPA